MQGAGSETASADRYAGWTAAAIAGLTALRLLWLALSPADLYPDEAQYWFWAKHLAFGYYSKPPLVAWLIALTTALFGDGEFAVRLAAPLLHAAAAALVYAIAARLYDRRVAMWAAAAYATLPGTSISAFIISTDAVLMPCWAAALYGFVRAREPGGGGWWALVGIAFGLGLLAKYAMAYWPICAVLALAWNRARPRDYAGLGAALLLGIALYLPNLWWNWSHGFVSYLHVRDNAALGRSLFHPQSLAAFVAAQFGVFGPVFFAGLVALAAAPRNLAEPRARLLACFAFPVLALLALVALASHAEPNWAAPAYVAASPLVVAWGLRRGWRRAVAASIALNLAAALVVFGLGPAAAALGHPLPGKSDPLHRLYGWRRLGEQVSARLAAHPGAKLLADDREVLAALIYYVRPHPFDAAIWEPLGNVPDQWALTNNLASHIGEDFLAVTDLGHGDLMAREFAEFIPLGTITISPGPGGSRTYRLYLGRGYRGK